MYILTIIKDGFFRKKKEFFLKLSPEEVNGFLMSLSNPAIKAVLEFFRIEIKIEKYEKD